MREDLKEKIKNLPQNSGVYIYKDELGEIIYVGKAKNLKNRVGSYFHTKLEPHSKTYSLVSRINDITYIIVDNEFDALILEAELVKKHQPKYNIVLKDDKSFLYIVIKNEKVDLAGKKTTLPLVLVQRKTEIAEKDVRFGPYTSSEIAKYITKVLRKIFCFRDCSGGKYSRYHKQGNPCLYGHIGLCMAPCVNFKPDDLKAYKDNINKIKLLLSGGSSGLIRSYESKMRSFSKKKEYEKAKYYRDLIEKFGYIRYRYRDAHQYIDNPYLLEDIANKALLSLKTDLPVLGNSPERIECYDIANISGKQAVGSMVAATDGKIDKSEYKRFKIKFKNSPDDVEMLFEVIHRRFQRNWEHPDLLVVDGGKGQVSAARAALEELNLNIPVIGLAKKQETIIYRQGSEFIELSLDKSNAGLNLLISLRNEAHRFAQSYHHLLRLKSLGV